MDDGARGRDAGGGPEPAGARDALAAVGAELAEAVTAAVPGWVERSVTGLVRAWSGTVALEVAADARAAGRVAADEVGAELRRLLAADVDEQWTNPMTVARRAVPHATAVLRRAGVGEVVRPADAEARDPDDVYGLSPSTFADLDPSLHELGIRWGAHKARAHLDRHRPRPAGPS